VCLDATEGELTSFEALGTTRQSGWTVPLHDQKGPFACAAGSLTRAFCDRRPSGSGGGAEVRKDDTQLQLGGGVDGLVVSENPPDSSQGSCGTQDKTVPLSA
jgi:hypothetical protein